MCIFTGPVKAVSNTQIFARGDATGRQILIYRMNVDADTDVAMVLPIPTAAGSHEDAVHFIDLKDCPEFFPIVWSAWPRPAAAPAAGQARRTLGFSPPPLKVQQVGAFEASFVPIIADFERLDERFRLPAGIWEKLPLYRTFGFVVFKLKAGNLSIHPMAFSFPRADARTLFFPTVHIHDGMVHERAEFAHSLVMQTESPSASVPHDWTESELIPRQLADFKKIEELVLPDQHFYKMSKYGEFDNRDVVLSLG
jgi:hypothetical protein